MGKNSYRYFGSGYTLANWKSCCGIGDKIKSFRLLLQKKVRFTVKEGRK